ncbi:MAG: YHS domain-containing protein [Planctomycetes bacterium]|nr:YHS domain-containing protein [Planctomycetota bacterium]
MLRPASPYQKERLVVDPVCGMTIPVSEAVGSVLHRGAVFHFCVEECRRKFEGEPGRFAR